MKDSIIILCGGGPAPGMNTVVMSVAKTFLSNGYRVIGLHGGYSGLFSQNRGGSYLQMSRFKPTDKDFEENFNLALFQENNIKLLVTVGGDDTASTANRIAKFLAAKQYPIANIHVPKTIDNDLPLPNNAPTFGFNSAKTTPLPSASTPRRTKARTWPAPCMRMPAPAATGSLSAPWAAAPVIWPWVSAKPRTAR